MKLTDIVTRLAALDYDTLRDLRDVTEYATLQQRLGGRLSKADRAETKAARAEVTLRRRGLSPLTAASAGLPAELSSAVGTIRVSDAGDVTATLGTLTAPAERALLLATVNALLDAKQPRAASRTISRDETRQRTRATADGQPDVTTRDVTAGETLAQGHVQIKRVAVYAKDDDGGLVLDADGKPVIDRYLRYAYLRVHTSLLDADGSTKPRVASIYLGSLQRPKPFYLVFSDPDNLDVTAEAIIAAFQRGGYDAVKRWRKSLGG